MNKNPLKILPFPFYCLLFWGCNTNLPKPSTMIPTIHPTITISSSPLILPSFTPSVTLLKTANPSSTYTNTNSKTMANTRTLTSTIDPTKRYYETNDNYPFSYIPPKHWNGYEKPEHNTAWQYKNESIQEGDECQLYFGFEDIVNTSAVEFYNYFYSINPDLEYLGSGKFYILAGYDAYRFSVKMVFNKRDIKTTYYAISNKDYLLIAAYERLFNTCVDQDGAVDNSIKTIRFE
jgi:hypothetical protein